ncbi:unnamed protein product [Peronospora belbahrii]|uniref:ABC transporter domain-containing protein n=1 Tax=Peronospora belbahrii TaxID=622444 RepID=A0AAU9KWU3_9STRA|nr:unnamed protein product [Peronospora belbahrii]
MTPGSATSASSFEERTSAYDGISDASTPASDRGLVAKSTRMENMTRLTKQPTKKLSFSSRESLARRLVDDEHNRNRIAKQEDDLLLDDLLSKIVIKPVPFINAQDEAKASSTSMIPISPRSFNFTRQIVVSPRRSMRRVVIRRTGVDGQIHEQVRYVDAEGQTVRQSGNFFSADTETDETSVVSSEEAPVTPAVSTPAKTLQRVTVRKTDEDGQVREEVQFVDANGNTVDGEGTATNVTTSTMIPVRSIARQVVTPKKLTQRTLRRTGSHGQVYEQVQYIDVDGNIVRTEGGVLDSISISSESAKTSKVVTPVKTTRRVVVRKTGVDGQVQEEVQYMDADGNVVRSEGTTLMTKARSSGPVSNAGRTTVTRSIVLSGQNQYVGIDSTVFPLVRRDGSSATDGNHIDRNDSMIEEKGGVLSSTRSCSGSVSSVTSDTSSRTSCRRIVTRRVMASPSTAPVVQRNIVRKDGFRPDAAYEEDVQSMESDDGSFTSNSGRAVTSKNGLDRRVTTRRVVTPHRVIQRMVVRKDNAGSGTDGLNIGADCVQSEDNASSDESAGGSSRGRYPISNRIMVLKGTQRVVSRPASCSDKSQMKDDDIVAVTDAPLSEKLETHVILGIEEGKPPIPVREVVSCVSSPAESVDVPSPNVDDGSKELPKDRVVAAVAGATALASTTYGGSNIIDDENKIIDGVLAVSSAPAVDELATMVTKDIAECEKDREQPFAGAGSWNIFDGTEKLGTPVEIMSSDDKQATTSETVVASHNQYPFDASEADASGAVADFDLRTEPMMSSYQDTNVVAQNSCDGDESETFAVISEVFIPLPTMTPSEESNSMIAEVSGPQAAMDSVFSPSSLRGKEVYQNPRVSGATGVAIDAIDYKMPETHIAADCATTETDATGGPFAVMETVEDDGLNMPKVERNIWKFRGARRPQSPRNAGVKLHDADTRGDIPVTCGIEPNDMIGLPAAHEQVAAAESGEVENATPVDSGLVSVSQHSEEHTGAKHEDVVEEKLEHADSLWDESSKKDESNQLASVIVSKKVGWSAEDEDYKMTPDSATHNDRTSPFDQDEWIRHSIQSDSISTNSADPVASSGKTIHDRERRTTEVIDSIVSDIGFDEHYVEIASPRRRCAFDDERLWTVKPCSLAWSRICLKQKSWKTFSMTTSLQDNGELVLDDVSGSVKAGEFLVITGPSKDESRALLHCLSGYEGAMKGDVTVNGRAWNEKMNRYVSYIMREDLFYETLTVHEHLITQSYLRMRRTHTDEMCLERVEYVIEEMGLLDCRDKLIGGGVSLCGISHGERKLLALATALLTNPSILFVENPTDGLDTFSAEKIVAKLHSLSWEKGLTVVVTLHHPSSHFYELFDMLYLVANASCVYDGKAADCVAYFSTIGYQCPEYMSPIDYFMLQMVVGDRESDGDGVARVDALKREWFQSNVARYTENAACAEAMCEDSVVNEYDQNNRYHHMGCCGQLWLLWARHIRQLLRYGFVFQWHLLAALLIGIVFGLVYLQIDLNDQHGIQNFAGSFFYVVVVQMLFVAYRTFVFMPRETVVALREQQEYRGGRYNLLCWYLTKIVAELPALIILSVALFVPIYLLVGIGHGFKVYLYMQIVIVLAGWAAVGLAFVTLGLLRHVTHAVIVYAILMVLFVAFGGLLMNVADIPDWCVWLRFISPIKYSYESLMKIFWQRVETIDCDRTVEGCVAFTGVGVLEYYSMEKRSALNDSLTLLAISLSFFFVAFWFLLVLTNKRMNGLQWRHEWDSKWPLGHRRQRVAAICTVRESEDPAQSSTNLVEQNGQHSSSGSVERSFVTGMESHYISVTTPRVGSRGICNAPSVTLGWRSLWLKAPGDKKLKSDDETEYLLSGAKGSALCGELLLITGPSNDSNVGLLKTLGGLQKTMKGNVMLNGVVSAAHKLSDHIVYVASDDLFFETLTVEEHLRFQAQLIVGKSRNSSGLCCGTGTSDLEAERVEMVLDELDLASKRHILIRYLSEADTKLLTFATALLDNPPILLAEEPTSGMDFYASQRVILKLRQLARGGRTVLVAMTHPSSHLYALFDTLYLLAGGGTVYHGNMREAVSYFSSLGYECPQYMSPIDYFIRQVSARKKNNETGNVQAELFKEAWSTRCFGLCLADNIVEAETQEEKVSSSSRLGCCSQVSLLFRRHLLRLARYRVAFGWQSFWMIVASVIFGLVFLQLNLDDQQDIQNWSGAFFLMILLQMLVMAYRTFVFLPREMAIIQREHRRGGYCLISWYMTKVFAELPALMILSVLLFAPAYLLIGIGHGFKLYCYMQLVMWLVGWSALGLASLLLDLVRCVRMALILYVLLLILFVLFGGLLMNADDIPDYLVWLHYISPVKYGYEALMKLFWGRIGYLACNGTDGSGSTASGSVVEEDMNSSMSSFGSFEDENGCIAHSGNEVLTHYSMDTSRDSRSDSFILLELTLLYFIIGYVFLSLRWDRHKVKPQRQS